MADETEEVPLQPRKPPLRSLLPNGPPPLLDLLPGRSTDGDAEAEARPALRNINFHQVSRAYARTGVHQNGCYPSTVLAGRNFRYRRALTHCPLFHVGTRPQSM